MTSAESSIPRSPSAEQDRTSLRKLVIAREQGYQLALDAIDAYLEHLRSFGCDSATARAKAAAEFAEGMSIDVDAEMASIAALGSMQQDDEVPL